MLLNASKCQGYSFWIIKGKLTEVGEITPCTFHCVEIFYFVEIFHFVEIQSTFCPYLPSKLEVFN